MQGLFFFYLSSFHAHLKKGRSGSTKRHSAIFRKRFHCFCKKFRHFFVISPGSAVCEPQLYDLVRQIRKAIIPAGTHGAVRVMYEEAFPLCIPAQQDEVPAVGKGARTDGTQDHPAAFDHLCHGPFLQRTDLYADTQLWKSFFDQ